MSHRHSPHPHRATGFSLVEMAIVLMIVALLLAGLTPSISGQIEQKRTIETKAQLNEIQQALIGYAIINRRLPCPASSTSSGIESFCTTASGGCTATTTVQSHGRCSNFNDGYLPAATLGIPSTTDNLGNKGFAVDSWGNRIRYAVTNSNTNAYTIADGMKTTGISLLTPNLQVCTQASATSNDCNSAADRLTSGVPVVIYSTGKNGGYGGAGTDEAENPNPNSADNDRAFVSHDPAPSTAASGEFDDIMIWVSGNVIINRMVAAGQLP